MFFNLYNGVISRETLENTFFINFDNLINEIKSFEKYTEEELLNNIDLLCISNLKNYLLDNKKYFKSCDDYLRLNALNLYFIKYAFDNIKLFLKMDFNYNETISIEKAFKNFEKNNSIVQRDYDNFKDRFKDFEDNDNLLNMYSLFYSVNDNNKTKYNIYKNLSTVFIHTIDEWGQCAYNNKNMLKSNIYESNENFNFRGEIDKNFILQFIMLLNLDINDIYYFERIYNTNFKLHLYKQIISLEEMDIYLNKNEITKLIKSMNKIIYLPNVFNNVELLLILLGIYIDCYREKDMEEFEKGIEELINDFIEYFLPLYNSLFLEILKIYCENNKISISSIKNKISLNNYLDNTIYGILSEHKTFLDKLNYYNKFKENEEDKEEENEKKKKKKKNEEIYYLISENIICYFNFNKLKQENIISCLNIFNKNIFNCIDYINEYQLNLKEFILKLNRLKQVEGSEF